MLATLLALASGPWMPAQAPTAPATVGPGTGLLGVHIDEPGDGNVWVLAPGYKARFGRDGVEYLPYFGAKAPRLFPVTFRLRSVRRGEHNLGCDDDVRPVVDGHRVSYARGGVREVWDLRRDEVEQSFVIEDMHGAGDLCVRIDVATDLAATDTEDGLTFAHATLGKVLYGDIVAFDAGGRRLLTPSRLVPGGIELRVPAQFVAHTRGAVTIDPIVRTIAVDSGADLTAVGEVAFDPSTGTWLVVYVREFSTLDTDIISRRFLGNGGLLEEVVVATGSRESRRPSVGANGPGSQFLIAWDEDTSVNDRVILGRTRAAASTAQSGTFTVLDTSGVGNDDFEPRVGGSIANDAAGATYAVVCRSDNAAGQHVSFMRVTTGATSTRVATLSTGLEDVTALRITKSRDTGEPWVCVYLVGSGSQFLVQAATAPSTGNSVIRTFVDSGTCQLGGIAGDGRNFLAVHSRVIAAGNSDIIGTYLQLSGSVLSRVAITNLTSREPGVTGTLDQTRPTVAFDGCRYTYAYQESTSVPSRLAVFAAVVAMPGAFFTDGHRPLHTAAGFDDRTPTMASTGEMGGALGRSFVMFDRILNSNIDAVGVLFDGISPGGGIASVATGCGLTLTALTAPILGSTLRMRAGRLAQPNQVFLIGLPIAPQVLCGAGCALGLSPILITVPGGTLDLPIPCGGTLVGAQFAVQNVQVDEPGGCTPPTTPIRLVTSNTLVVTLQ